MPYIITTGHREPAFAGHVQRIDPATATRTAVATLDEAREAIVRAVVGTSKRQSVLDDARWTYADSLPESGGTIGPLPDGTVIEVRALTWPDLGRRTGSQVIDHPNPLTKAGLLAAFNAQQ